MHKTVRQKQFVQGEGFLYLGRSYRLNLVDEQEQPLKFYHGRFHLSKAILRVPESYSSIGM